MNDIGSSDQVVLAIWSGNRYGVLYEEFRSSVSDLTEDDVVTSPMADGTCDFVPTNHLGSVEEFSAGAEFFHPGFVSRNVLKGHASLAAGDGLFEVARRHGQVHLLLSDLLDLVGAASVDLPPNGHHGCVPAHVADI